MKCTRLRPVFVRWSAACQSALGARTSSPQHSACIHASAHSFSIAASSIILVAIRRVEKVLLCTSDLLRTQ